MILILAFGQRPGTAEAVVGIIEVPRTQVHDVSLNLPLRSLHNDPRSGGFLPLVRQSHTMSSIINPINIGISAILMVAAATKLSRFNVIVPSLVDRVDRRVDRDIRRAREPV